MAKRYCGRWWQNRPEGPVRWRWILVQEPKEDWIRIRIRIRIREHCPRWTTRSPVNPIRARPPLNGQERLPHRGHDTHTACPFSSHVHWIIALVIKQVGPGGALVPIPSSPLYLANNTGGLSATSLSFSQKRQFLLFASSFNYSHNNIVLIHVLP